MSGKRRSPPGSKGDKGDKPARSKKRKESSKRWLDRHFSDPYVAEARRQGFRSRAAFKLIELDDRFRLLRPGQRIVDLGAAPGGWTQVAVARTRTTKKRGIVRGGGRSGGVIAIDRNDMEPIAGAHCIVADVSQDDTLAATVIDTLGGRADVVLSDVAPSTIGHPGADHLRIVALAEIAFEFAAKVLAPGGAFVCKVFQGGTETGLLNAAKQDFAVVRHAKPPSSRAESAEIYLVATGFRGKRSPDV